MRQYSFQKSGSKEKQQKENTELANTREKERGGVEASKSSQGNTHA